MKTLLTAAAVAVAVVFSGASAEAGSIHISLGGGYHGYHGHHAHHGHHGSSWAYGPGFYTPTVVRPVGMYSSWYPGYGYPYGPAPVLVGY